MLQIAVAAETHRIIKKTVAILSTVDRFVNLLAHSDQFYNRIYKHVCVLLNSRTNVSIILTMNVIRVRVTKMIRNN